MLRNTIKRLDFQVLLSIPSFSEQLDIEQQDACLQLPFSHEAEICDSCDNSSTGRENRADASRRSLWGLH